MAKKGFDIPRHLSSCVSSSFSVAINENNDESISAINYGSRITTEISTHNTTHRSLFICLSLLTMKSSIALSVWTSSLSLMMTMPTTVAFSVVVSSQQPARVQTALDAQIGVFFGTSTGSTEEVAELIQQAFGDDVAAGPFDIDALDGSVGEEFAKHDALIVGTPTWNTGT